MESEKLPAHLEEIVVELHATTEGHGLQAIKDAAIVITPLLIAAGNAISVIDSTTQYGPTMMAGIFAPGMIYSTYRLKHVLDGVEMPERDEEEVRELLANMPKKPY